MSQFQIIAIGPFSSGVCPPAQRKVLHMRRLFFQFGGGGVDDYCQCGES